MVCEHNTNFVIGSDVLIEHEMQETWEKTGAAAKKEETKIITGRTTTTNIAQNA